MVKREPKWAGYFSSYGAGVLRVTETIPAKTQKVRSGWSQSTLSPQLAPRQYLATSRHCLKIIKYQVHEEIPACFGESFHEAVILVKNVVDTGFG